MTSHAGYEGFPRVLVEAMAAGLPAVVTEGSDTGGLIQQGVSGFVCGRDPEELADGLRAARDLDRAKVADAVAALSAPRVVREVFFPDSPPLRLRRMGGPEIAGARRALRTLRLWRPPVKKDLSSAVAAIVGSLPGFTLPFVAALVLSPRASDVLLLALSVAITQVGDRQLGGGHHHDRRVRPVARPTCRTQPRPPCARSGGVSCGSRSC